MDKEVGIVLLEDLSYKDWNTINIHKVGLTIFHNKAKVFGHKFV